MNSQGRVAPGPPTSSIGDVLRYAEAAKLLDVPLGTLYAWVHKRRVPHFRLSGRAVRFSRSALLNWLEAAAVSPVSSPGGGR